MSSPSSPKVQHPGHVEILGVFIEKFQGKSEITDFFVEFNIKTSIADTTAIGTFTIIDAKNILSNLPIESGDKMEIKIGYMDGVKTLKMRIVEINRITNADRQRAYVIECVSELQFNSFFNKISRHYEGTTSEIAKAIFDQFTHEEVGIWDQSANVQSLVIPNWSPMRAIKWLAMRSKAYFDDVTFRFWQDANLRYNFTPVEKINEIYADAPLTFSYNNDTRREQKGNNDSVSNSPSAVRSILNLKYLDSFNIKEAVPMLKKVKYNIDTTQNTTRIVTYDHWREFNEKDYLNKVSLWAFADYGQGDITINSLATRTIDTFERNEVESFASNLISRLGDAQKIEIQVVGTQTIDIGQVVNVEIPSPEPPSETQPDQLDLRWSGRYYVVAIRNVFNLDGQQTYLELAKESLVV